LYKLILGMCIFIHAVSGAKYVIGTY
jgi:hypothetical protein